ncbi:MAG TPA: siderophore-interacting protein, partial [Ilumatobacteraceae bacterium]|nr:siderophore-interacting protein [Ilumatobacteraceae bacterium]
MNMSIETSAAENLSTCVVTSAETVELPIILRRMMVRAVEQITPVVRRVVVGGEQFDRFVVDGAEQPGFESPGVDDHVKLFFAGPDGLVLPTQGDGELDWPEDPRPVARSYTVRAVDHHAKTVTIDMVLHGHGFGARWAAAVTVGDEVHLAGPKQWTAFPNAPWYLLVGDDTALPAIARWLEALAPDAVVRVVIATDHPGEYPGLVLAGDRTVTWVAPAMRQGEQPLTDAVAALDWPAATPFVWAAGEVGDVGALRRLLRDQRGLDRASYDLAAYW